MVRRTQQPGKCRTRVLSKLRVLLKVLRFYARVAGGFACAQGTGLLSTPSLRHSHRPGVGRWGFLVGLGGGGEADDGTRGGRFALGASRKGGWGGHPSVQGVMNYHIENKKPITWWGLSASGVSRWYHHLPTL